MFHRETVDYDALDAFTTDGARRPFRLHQASNEARFDARFIRLRNQSAARSVEFSLDGVNVDGVAATTATTASDTGSIETRGRRDIWIRRAGGAAVGAPQNVIIEAWK